MQAAAKYAKAIVSGLFAGVAMYFAMRGPAGAMTAGGWETVVVSTLGGAGITWAVPNTKAAPKPDAPAIPTMPGA